MLSWLRAWRGAVLAALLGGLLSFSPVTLPSATVGTALAAESAGDKPATVLRLTLGRLLAEHAYLTLEAMRSVALSTPDRTAIVAALNRNTQSLGGAIESVYGAAAAAEFNRLWTQHIDAVFDYAEAATAKNKSAGDAARRALAAYRSAFSAFLMGANPHLSADGEAVALQLHLDQLVAFADGDYALGFETGRQAYSHMFQLGDDLARAIAEQFPSRYPGAKVAFSPKAALRVTLGRLLGEHLVLAAETMRSGIARTPDSTSARAALDANTADLSTAIGRVYGDDAARGFEGLWFRHTTGYLAYIDALAASSPSRKAAALSVLAGYPAEFAAFLGAANPKLSKRAVEGLIRRHGESLVSQVDAYAARDYPRSVTIVGEAHSHMFEVGDALADAIAAQFPDRFDDLEELPNTDASGRSAVDHSGRGGPLDPALIVLVLVGAIGAAAVGLRRRRRVTARR